MACRVWKENFGVLYVCVCACVCKLGALVVTHQGELLITVIQIKIKVLAFMLLWLTCDDELSLFIYEK